MKMYIPYLLSRILPAIAILLGLAPFAPALAKEKTKADYLKILEKKKKTPVSTPKTSTSQIILINGDKLQGKPLNIDNKGRLTFDSQKLEQPATFPTKNILTLKLDPKDYKKTNETLARVTLNSRFRENSNDTIIGSISELTPKTIKLNTWYAGLITIKRSMVKSLNIINNSPGYYFGPNNLAEWTTSDGKQSWKFYNGKLSSLSSEGIGRDVKLAEKSQISFDLQWDKSLQFSIELYSNDITQLHPEAFYGVHFNRTYAFIRTYGKVNEQVRIVAGRGQPIQVIPTTNRAHFDIFANRTLGTFNIYIDGEKACLLRSQNPSPKNIGSGISFVSDRENPITISNISITPWNGTTLPDAKSILTATSKENNKDKKTQTPPHKIILNNGDEVPGTVGKVQDGQMVIETQFTPIKIPIKRIKSLSLGDQGEEPKKYAGDVRAWFPQGGHLTLKLISLKDGKLKGFSQPTGNITIDLNAFNQIDFQIYNPKANELREKIR